jgi:hypothetical protein
VQYRVNRRNQVVRCADYTFAVPARPFACHRYSIAGNRPPMDGHSGGIDPADMSGSELAHG